MTLSISDAALLLEVPENEIAATGTSDVGPVVRTGDGQIYVVEEHNDAAPSLAFLTAPTATYGDTFAVHTPRPSDVGDDGFDAWRSEVTDGANITWTDPASKDRAETVAAQASRDAERTNADKVTQATSSIEAIPVDEGMGTGSGKPRAKSS